MNAINLRDYLGRTPFYLACIRNHKKVSEYLIKHKANLHVKDNNEQSIFQVALHENQKWAVDLIRNHLITKVYELMYLTQPETLKKQIIDSVNKDESTFILNEDYLLAFRSIDVNEYNDNFELKKNPQIFAFFLSFEFKEKFTVDVIQFLRNQIEILDIYSLKLKRISSGWTDNEHESDDGNKLTLNQFFCFFSENDPRTDASCRNIAEIFEKIRLYKSKLIQKLNLADEMYELINERCKMLQTIQNVKT
jgi:hypothetical protein